MKPRRPVGSAITEMGPALFVFLILIFFPMMNIIQIGVGYALAQTYHQYISREIAFRRPEARDAAIQKVNQGIDSNAIYQFIRVTNKQVNSVVFLDDSNAVINLPLDDNSRRRLSKVRVRTTLTVSPYFTLPFFPPNIPGVSAPIPFSAETDRPQDEKGLN